MPTSSVKEKQAITLSLPPAASTSSSAIATSQSSTILGRSVKENTFGHSSNPPLRNIHTQSVTQQDIQITLWKPMTMTESSGAPGMSVIIFPLLPLYISVQHKLGL